MDIGNAAEWIGLGFALIGVFVAGVVFTTKITSRLDDHESRIAKLELDTKTELSELRKVVDSLHTDVLKGFAEIKVALANKQDRDK